MYLSKVNALYTVSTEPNKLFSGKARSNPGYVP
jgi:hypothetical protein